MRLVFEYEVLNPLLNPDIRDPKDEEARRAILAQAKKIASTVILNPVSVSGKLPNKRR